MNRSEAGKKGYEKTKEHLNRQREEASRLAREKYESNIPQCLNCGKVITFENRRNKFCSKPCSAIYSNSQRPSISKRSRVCSCGKPKKLTNKYCPDCIEKQVYNRIFSLEDAKIDRVRKRILLEQRGNRCEVCGLVEWMGDAIPIELDHIDGDADNNSPENLRLICPNCHAQTETYKGGNVGRE